MRADTTVWAIREVSATGNITPSDELVVVTANTITLTLPAASTVNKQVFIIRNEGTGIVTVNTVSGTINGAASVTLRENGCLVVFGDNANYKGQAFVPFPSAGVYERHIQIPAMLSGSPAEQPTQVAVETVGGLQFSSALSKIAYCQWEVPDDWDGGDVFFEVDWFPDAGAMSGTDTVKWDLSYRAIVEGELVNAGTVAALSITDSADYAQYQTKHSRFTLPFDDANQPLTKQDHVYFKISRDVGVANDFAGTIVVPAFEIIYMSTGLPTT